jgi:chitin synthase
MGSSGGGFGRRRSSLGRRGTRVGSMAYGMGAPLLSEVSDEEASGGRNSFMMNADGVIVGAMEPQGSSDGSEDDEPQAQRDDLINPYWIEDRDLKNGPIDFLPGVEIQFWKDLIEKYLEPLLKDAQKEKMQAKGLKTLRNQMVFSFFMLNAVFVVVVYLMQSNKDTIYIRWPWGAKPNITYVGPNNFPNPTVEIEYDYLDLEPVGFVFIVFFGFVLVVQLIGNTTHNNQL